MKRTVSTESELLLHEIALTTWTGTPGIALARTLAIAGGDAFVFNIGSAARSDVRTVVRATKGIEDWRN
ncbi:MAG: hypothetical protein M3P49_01195 [Actinomycetota bacterium]|nr:hypothetical protein [Actinomycetota bacterium]